MSLNPVERRLMDLAGHWDEFRRDPTKRLLVWQAPDNATRMFQCFFEMQKYEVPYRTGDLFIAFNAPFEHSIQYSRALKNALLEKYQASREDLQKQGIEPDWVYDPAKTADSATGFLQALRSLGSQYHRIIGNVVAVFMPKDVSDERAYSAWLLRALNTEPPERLRLAVVDSDQSSRLPSLIEAKHARMHTQRVRIDAMVTAQETFAQEGATGPAAVFRNFLMGVVSLIETGSMPQIHAKASDARKFARAQNWADQEVVIQMLVCAGLMKHKQYDAAIDAYRDARGAAERARSAAHPAGGQLVLQTWFGEAGAHFATGRMPQAAKCYDEAAAIARALPHPILAIEAFRMSGFCLGRNGQPADAVERGLRALEVGKTLKSEARAMTTLPIAAVQLLRDMDPQTLRDMEQIKWRMDVRRLQTRQQLEARVAPIEKTLKPEPFRAIEADYERECAQARDEAENELASAAASGGNARFRETYSAARSALGSEWPLGSNVAFAPMSPADVEKIMRSATVGAISP